MKLRAVARVYPEVAGELGAEAVEERLPVELGIGAAYLGVLRGGPPAEDLDQRLLVRAPPCTGDRTARAAAARELDQRLRTNDERSRRMRVQIDERYPARPSGGSRRRPPRPARGSGWRRPRWAPSLCCRGIERPRRTWRREAIGEGR